MTDYYDVLEISKEASADEIKKAYRRLALKYHPDRNKDNHEAEAKFKKVSEAYEVLGNEEKRRMYDQYGTADPHGAGFGAHPGAGFGGFSSMDDALRTFMNAFGGGASMGGGESIFDSFFGGGQSRGEASGARGASKKVEVELTYEEAAQGVKKKFVLAKFFECDSCHGTGAASPKAVKTCSRCRGMGQVTQNRGFFSMTMPCPECQGGGKVITDPCSSCQGHGRVKKKEPLEISIPAGVDDGMRLQMVGYGDVGELGGTPGDLYVYISLKPHAVFKRDGDNLLLELPITGMEAALGCKKEVPTLLGKTCRVTIPEGTQPGKVLRLKSEGFSNPHTRGKGDLLIQVVVETPVHLNSRQKELLKELMELETPSNYPHKKEFFDRVKTVSG